MGAKVESRCWKKGKRGSMFDMIVHIQAVLPVGQRDARLRHAVWCLVLAMVWQQISRQFVRFHAGLTNLMYHSLKAAYKRQPAPRNVSQCP